MEGFCILFVCAKLKRPLMHLGRVHSFIESSLHLTPNLTLNPRPIYADETLFTRMKHSSAASIDADSLRERWQPRAFGIASYVGTKNQGGIRNGFKLKGQENRNPGNRWI